MRVFYREQVGTMTLSGWNNREASLRGIAIIMLICKPRADAQWCSASGCLYFHHYRNGTLRYPNSPLRVPPVHTSYRVLYSLYVCYTCIMLPCLWMWVHIRLPIAISNIHILDDNQDNENDN